MRRAMTPEEEVTFNAMWRGLALVFIPAGIFVFGLIYFVSPTRRPPSQSWANGTYLNDCCRPLVLRDGKLTMGSKTVRYIVSESKFGNEIDVAEGIGIRNGTIETGSSFVYVYFNDESAASPALGEARSLHLVALGGDGHLTFTKRE